MVQPHVGCGIEQMIRVQCLPERELFFHVDGKRHPVPVIIPRGQQQVNGERVDLRSAVGVPSWSGTDSMTGLGGMVGSLRSLIAASENRGMVHGLPDRPPIALTRILALIRQFQYSYLRAELAGCL